MTCHLRHLVLTTAAAVAAATPPRAHELDAAYTFEEYLAHFDKTYDDPVEYARRCSPRTYGRSCFTTRGG